MLSFNPDPQKALDSNKIFTKFSHEFLDKTLTENSGTTYRFEQVAEATEGRFTATPVNILGTFFRAR